MKIKCDVCDKEEASIFCSADEAALCYACDRRVHLANKLSKKHHRFSLLNPSSSKDSPRCDICQERRALLFCQEDRALFCRECDIPIHNANAHTKSHNRFLLTGIKVSSISPTSSSSNERTKSENEMKKNSSIETVLTSNCYSTMNTSVSTTSNLCSVDSGDQCIIQQGSVSTSSISEYLMETLPGWHVEDFLDPSTFSPYYGFCNKIHDEKLSHFVTGDGESIFTSSNSSVQDFAIWDPHYQNGMINNEEESKDLMKVSKKRNGDDIMVPRISPFF